MYTPLEEAKEEVWQRWNDAKLRQRVLEYVGQLPEGYGVEPCAVLSRHVATPNFEAQRFYEVARPTGLKMINDVYPLDKFCSKNPDKYWLAKMAFHSGKGKKNGHRLTNLKLVVFHAEDGKAFADMSTFWGDNFVTFHQQLFTSFFPDVCCIDNSEWTKRANLSIYYREFLAVFVCNGILFENFLEDESEADFTCNIVRPAFEKVTKLFGLKPLIVRLLPEESEAEPYWRWYPGHLEDEVRKSLNGSKGVGACLVG